MLKNPDKDKIKETQKNIKSRKDNGIDLEGDVLVNKNDLDVLTNAKYSNTTIKHKNVSSKKSKILLTVFGAVGVVGIAGGVTGIIIGTRKTPVIGDFLTINFIVDSNKGECSDPLEVKIQQNTKWKDFIKPSIKGKQDLTKGIQYSFNNWVHEDGSEINDDEIISVNTKFVATFISTTISKYHNHTLSFLSGQSGILQDSDSLTIQYKSEEVYDVRFSSFKFLYDLPHVIPNQDYKFDKWVDKSGNEITDNTPITQGETFITATYKYIQPTTQFTITYDCSEASIIKGKTSVKVNENTTFGESYKPEVTKDGFYFNGWKKQDGTLITDEYIITEDITLIPDFVEYSSFQTVTFKIPSDVEYAGSLTSYCYTDQLWSEINKPVVTKEGYHFVCWYVEYEGKQYELKDTTKISYDLEAMPYFEPDEVYCEIKYESEDESKGTLSGRLTDYALSGTLFKDLNLPTVTPASSQCVFSGWYLNGETKLQPETPINTDCKIIAKFTKDPIIKENLLNIAAKLDSLVKINLSSTNTPDLKYSFDDINWIQLDKQGADLVVPKGNVLYLKGKNLDNTTNFSGCKITILGRTKLAGTLTALLYDGEPGKTEISTNKTFSSLFGNSTGLFEISKNFLPTLDLSNTTYRGMFSNCTSLITAPELPANKLSYGCYASMFSNCTSLVNIPSVLPADTVPTEGYYHMFRRCSSIKTTPKMLFTNVNEDSCYSMYQECSSLQQSEPLYATDLKHSSYQCMYWKCTSLKSAPIMNIKTVDDYSCYSMFYECSSLTINKDGKGTKFFTCPSDISKDVCVYAMFYGTLGLFEGHTVLNSSPDAGETYYFE